MKLLFAVLALAISPLAQAQGVTLEERQVCRAAIGALFGRDPRIIRVDGVKDSVMFLSYIRKDDGSLWAYRCKLEGSRVMWGSRDGRWRDNALDEVVDYSISSGGVTIKVGYRSNPSDATTHKYKKSQLGN